MSEGLPVDGIILLGAGLLLVGILIVGFSDRLRVPAALLSLGVGMVFGSDVLGVVNVDDPEMVRNLSVVALVIILFEGGLTTKPSALREAGPPGFLLSTMGVVITAGVTALGVEAVFGLGWRTSLLLGAVVASTDAAVVFDLVRRAPLPRRLAAILEVESGANDPVAIVLTVGLLATFESQSVGFAGWIGFAAWQLIGGLLVGLGIGLVSRWVLSFRLRPEGLYPIVAVGLAGLSYGVAASVSASGFLAVYVTGLLIGATVPRRRRSIRSFHASLANAADIGLFLLLGLLVFPSDLPGVAVPALVVTVILIVLARPLAILLLMTPFRLPWREQVVLSWAGLRGAVPIVLATFPATAGIEEGQTIFNVVFFVVLTSTLLQGTTTMPLVRRLGLEARAPAWQSVAEALPLDVPEIDLAELVVTPDLAIADTSLSVHPSFQGVLVIAILREGEAIIPTGATIIRPGDVLILSIDERLVQLTDVTAWARGEEMQAKDPETAKGELLEDNPD
ncbi:MAG: potassium/proton antiporter [Acidimicrobiia bacterium]